MSRDTWFQSIVTPPAGEESAWTVEWGYSGTLYRDYFYAEEQALEFAARRDAENERMAAAGAEAPTARRFALACKGSELAAAVRAVIGGES